ncbi:hypothetical protein SDC9_164840 [bioreactor metagenome]|uniref:Uncharacterized protein n=1 Tax=bioreactor metagenome TaxID=1076179 RepID=A0A645FSR1_9ZZZZ
MSRKLAVGFVEDNPRPFREAANEVLHLFGRQGQPRGVVGVVQPDELRFAGYRLSHFLKVHGEIVSEGNFPEDGPHDEGYFPVEPVGSHREDDLVARVEVDLAQGLEHALRPVGQGDPFGFQAGLPGDEPFQLAEGNVGIGVQPDDLFRHGRPGRREGPPGVLVGPELHYYLETELPPDLLHSFARDIGGGRGHGLSHSGDHILAPFRTFTSMMDGVGN